MPRKNDITETLEFYNANSIAFSTNTFDVEFSNIQEWFCKYLYPGDYILDFGCGSGRDTRYFLEHGYYVDATDGSEELCKLASRNTGIEVKHLLFQELNEIEKYDGLWACSSILHLPYDELKKVFYLICRALKRNGIFYTSFKYGDFEGMRDGRYFTDMTENKLGILLSKIKLFELGELKITSDVRVGRDDEKWLNVILMKN